ncbi:MAG: GntR family transcriptional regulator [Pseudomonadota bacterium]
MNALDQISDRQTSADVVFGQLYDEIVGLNLLPGARISEVEVAKRFDLSRQPIREAFGRLSRMGLIKVSPQRPTVVRHFSLDDIQNARFIRTAIETDVVRKACEERDTSVDALLDTCIANQQTAVADNDADSFHALDYEFHRLLCRSARAEFAFEQIAASKGQVDRLCMLALTSQSSMEKLFNDHVAVLDAIRTGNSRKADKALRRHLDRLTPTIASVYEKHRDYFE